MNKKFPRMDYIIPLIEKNGLGTKTRLLLVSKNSCLQKIDDILKNLSSKGYKLESINMHHIVDRGKHGYIWDIVLTSNKSTLDRRPKTIDELLAKDDEEVESYTVITGEKGYLFNQYISGLRTGNGERVVLWGEPNIRGVFASIRKDYGELGKIILGKLGEYVGRELAKKYRETGGKNVDEALLMLVHGGVTKGAYALKEFKITRGPKGSYLARIVFDRHLEEEVIRDEGIRDCSSYQAGVFRGFLREVLGEKNYTIEVSQPKCIGKGDDYSIFLLNITPRK